MIKIYKLKFADGAEYVGQTRQDLRVRLRQHVHAPVNHELRRRLTAGEPYGVDILSQHGSQFWADWHERRAIRSLAKPINKTDRIGRMPGSGNPPLSGRSMFTGRRGKLYPRDESRVQTCRICRMRMAAEYFHSDSSRSTGLASKCKQCASAIGDAMRKARQAGEATSTAYRTIVLALRSGRVPRRKVMKRNRWVVSHPQSPAIVRAIIARVAKHYGYTLDEFLDFSIRKRALSRARHVATYLCREDIPATFTEIARAFGCSHPAIRYGCRRIKCLLRDDPAGSLARSIRELRSAEATSDRSP